MAKALKDFDFSVTRQSKYPWDKWSDGQIWSVESGTDFQSKPESFVQLLYKRAKDTGHSVRVKFVENGDKATVVFQFTVRASTADPTTETTKATTKAAEKAA